MKVNDCPPVWIGPDISEPLNNWLEQAGYTKIWILTDRNSDAFCLDQLINKVPLLAKASLITIEPGEEAKSLASCEKIWDKLTYEGADRKSLLCNLGGGVVSDLGGFAASAFMRGISFIQIPTTLLAMVDATIGGKTGINFSGIKNLIGSFQHASGVFAQTNFLASLHPHEIFSGYAEMLKHSLIEGGKHWQSIREMENPTASNLDELLIASIQLKLRITNEDFKESGLREVLNLGHTTAHALESLYFEQKQPLMHGFAVAAGMAIETHLAEHLQTGLQQSEAKQIREYIYQIFPPVKFTPDQINRLIDHMQHDKKNNAGKIRFSLLASIGNARHGFEASTTEIEMALNMYLTDVSHH